jgi:subtilisin family serine protease
MTSSLAGLPTFVPSLTLPALTPAVPTVRASDREAQRLDQYGAHPTSPQNFLVPPGTPAGALRFDPATQRLVAGPNDHGASAASTALRALADPPAAHPMMVYSADIRRNLAREGLPTDARGVRVTALGEPGDDHGPSVVRSIAGPVGLARGARVELPPQSPIAGDDRFADRPMEAFARGVRAEQAWSGKLGLDETIRAGVDTLESEVYAVRTEIRDLHQRTPAGSQTSIANLSRGRNPARMGVELADAVAREGNSAPLLVEHNAKLVAAGHPPLDMSKDADVATLRGDLIEALTRAAETGPGRTQLDAARADLATEVRAARDKGIVVFASTGNSHMGSDGPFAAADRASILGTPGIVFVGAADIGDPRVAHDDKTARFSSSGAHLTGPGVRMPVGTPERADRSRPQPADIYGTSFSSPYVAGVAALMVRANPKITPDQLEQALLRTARDDAASNRDGAGLVDPVSAVRAARALAVGR